MGLVKALGKKIQNISHHEIHAPSRWKSLVALLLKKFGTGETLPVPDLIMGAGNRTHLAMLAAKRAYSGKTIVLMKPTLPMGMFDLCLIPKHDSESQRTNILLTDGVLNPMQPATEADPNLGLFLIGGPSAHYRWDTQKILGQVVTLVQEKPNIHWTLTTSRRTPSECTKRLVSLEYPNLKVIPAEDTPKGWVSKKLSVCKTAWVSEDSVSMVYEALTAGAFTGLLSVPKNKESSRVQRSVELLLEQSRVVDFKERTRLHKLKGLQPLAEADRCADYIISKFG